ncbi:hypothetical protein, partial [Mycobacterium persicum]|uniref:hypothetical protein n=1 Tax=Mycobacterium persicum TaxID=1487726 RepID=UPI000ADBC156
EMCIRFSTHPDHRQRHPRTEHHILVNVPDHPDHFARWGPVHHYRKCRPQPREHFADSARVTVNHIADRDRASATSSAAGH